MTESRNRSTPGEEGGDGEPRFARHLTRLAPLFRHLAAHRRRDPRVCAVLAVEMYGRTRLERAGEYALWKLWSRVAPGRVERLSVGIAQVQLRHWRALGFMSGTGFSRIRLRRVRAPEANYDVCRAYLRWAIGDTNRAPAEIARAYTGGRDAEYVARLHAALRALSGEER